MSLRTNTIISLENNEKYVVLNETMYGGVKYFLVMGVDENKDIIPTNVAIVEEIDETTGQITCSNSAWQSTFFFLSHITPTNNRYDWSHYTCQGFIYNPFAFSPNPPTPPISIYVNSNKWLKARTKKIVIKL